MIIRISSLALGASLLLNAPFAYSLSPSDIPSDTPIASLISTARANLAQGKANDALTYFDVAVARDPKNYLTIFQRGATYLSLGKNAQANDDFDKVLSIKPGFEGALLQRAKIKSRNADWDAAKKDYKAAGKEQGAEYAELEEAQGAAVLASDAEKAGDWEGCISQAGTAILVASTALSLRQIRARCRFEKGEVLEGVADLQHVLQIAPGSIEPHLQISSMLFYSLSDTEKGMAQIRKCLHSDPDSKICSRLHRQEKKLDKALKQVRTMKEKRQYNNVIKSLVGSREEIGLIDNVKAEVGEAKEAGTIHKNSPNELYSSLVEMACECYTEVFIHPFFVAPNISDHLIQMNNIKKALPYCTEALSLNPVSLPGLLSLASRQLEAEEFEPAIATLNTAKDAHPSASQIPSLLQKAHTLLKRSKNKDYYKVLNVPSTADDRTIKTAYRAMSRQHHPDKVAGKEGVTKEQAEKKMATINEAYEVLSDPELRARFDRGDDPNSQESQGSPFQGSPFGTGPGGQQFFFKSGGSGGGGGFKFQQGGGGFQFPGGFGFP